jgi:hypothetical protein
VAVRKRAAEGIRYDFGYVDTERAQTEQNTSSLDPHPISHRTMPYGRLHVIGESWLHVILPPSASCGLAAGFCPSKKNMYAPGLLGLICSIRTLGIVTRRHLPQFRLTR